MKAARDEERAVAETQDLGEEDQEQQPTEQEGNAQVHQPGNAAGRRRERRARAAPNAIRSSSE